MEEGEGTQVASQQAEPHASRRTAKIPKTRAGCWGLDLILVDKGQKKESVLKITYSPLDMVMI
jgi:hypothetical protein